MNSAAKLEQTSCHRLPVAYAIVVSLLLHLAFLVFAGPTAIDPAMAASNGVAAIDDSTVICGIADVIPPSVPLNDRDIVICILGSVPPCPRCGKVHPAWSPPCLRVSDCLEAIGIVPAVP
jgi:hypothetical protein